MYMQMSPAQSIDSPWLENGMSMAHLLGIHVVALAAEVVMHCCTDDLTLFVLHRERWSSCIANSCWAGP